MKIVPEHCYIVEKVGEIVAVMVLHPQGDVFEIEDFHVKEVQQNKKGTGFTESKIDGIPGKC